MADRLGRWLGDETLILATGSGEDFISSVLDSLLADEHFGTAYPDLLAGHLLCTVAAGLYSARELADRTVGSCLDFLFREAVQRVGLSPSTEDREAFVQGCVDALAEKIGQKAADVAMAHLGLPTAVQLAALAVVVCPDPAAHQEVEDIFEKEFAEPALVVIVEDEVGGLQAVQRLRQTAGLE